MSTRRLGRTGLPPELPLYVLGVALAALAGAQLLVNPASRIALVLAVGVPAAVGIGVAVYGGLVLRRSDRRAGRARNVLVVCAAVLLVSEAAMLLIVAVRLLRGRPPADPLFLQAIALSTGAVLGVPAGLYYDELVQKRRALREEIERATALNQQLTVVNRVLRHNVRTELNVLGGHLEQLGEAGAWEDRESTSLGECREALGRLQELVEKVRYVEELGAVASDQRQDAAAVVTRAVIAARDRTDPIVEVRMDLPPEAPVLAHPLLETAVGELVENAIQHAGGPVVVAMNVDEDVQLVVADEGPGIPDHELDALDREVEGPLEHASGVGLWLVNWVAEASEGEFAVADREEGGTVARLRLRRARGEGNPS